MLFNSSAKSIGLNGFEITFVTPKLDKLQLRASSVYDVTTTIGVVAKPSISRRASSILMLLFSSARPSTRKTSGLNWHKQCNASVPQRNDLTTTSPETSSDSLVTSKISASSSTWSTLSTIPSHTNSTPRALLHGLRCELTRPLFFMAQT